MMIRSTPPRSENLAVMPVPAPAPMIGSPAAIRARRRASARSRPMNGILYFRRRRSAEELSSRNIHATQQARCNRLGEFWIVDVQIELEQAHVVLGMIAQSGEKCRIGGRIVEGLTCAVQRAHSAQRQQ